MKYIRFLFFILLVFTLNPALSGQQMQVEIDSLWRLYRVQTEEYQKIDNLNDICYAYRRLSPDSMLKYTNQAIEHALAINYAPGLAYAYKNKGIANFKLGTHPDTAIFYYQKAIGYAEEASDYYTQAACYNNIALIYTYNLSYNQTIQNLLKGLKIFNEHIPEENRLKALILGNLGTAYHKQESSEKGISYLKEALAIGERIHDQTITSIFMSELAMAKMDIGQENDVYHDVLNVLPINEQLGDLESKAATLLTLGEIECRLFKYELALTRAQEALDIAKTNNFSRKEVEALVLLSRIKKETGYIDQALTSAKQARGIAQKNEMFLLEANALLTLADLSELKKQPIAALQYLRAYNLVHERNRDKENTELVASLEAEYQTKNEETQIELLQKEKIAQTNYIRFLWAVASFFLVLLCIGAYVYFLKWRTSNALNEKNSELGLAEQKLHAQNDQLQAYIRSNLQLENFAYLASHDLREPMRTIVSFSQLLQKSAVKKLDLHEREYLDFIQEGTRRIETLVNDLLTFAKINNSSMVIEKIDLNNTLEQVFQDLQQLIREQKAVIQVQQLPKIMLGDPSRIYQLFQNLISNAIKYSKEEEAPIIEIRYKLEGKFHHFSIADNGIGIAPQFYDRIFLLFKTLKNKSISNSSGIGLATCKKIVEQMGGKIWLESIEQEGSTFHFTLPVKPEKNKNTSVQSLEEALP